MGQEVDAADQMMTDCIGNDTGNAGTAKQCHSVPARVDVAIMVQVPGPPELSLPGVQLQAGQLEVFFGPGSPLSGDDPCVPREQRVRCGITDGG